VILDRGKESSDAWEFADLARMIHLEEEDVFVPATYQDAPKVCIHCRLAGHERKSCPDLASVQCFRCKKKGHIHRHCHEAELRVAPSASKVQSEDQFPEATPLSVENPKISNADNNTDEFPVGSKSTEPSMLEVTDDEDITSVIVQNNKSRRY
jgi:hypothetical protein